MISLTCARYQAEEETSMRVLICDGLRQQGVKIFSKGQES